MAKISAKNPSQKHLAAAHKTYQWSKTELDALPGMLEQQKEAELAKVARKLNKKLAKSAFAACDKKELAAFQMEEKLHSYDVKHYLDQRGVNHGTAKRIFKAVHAGQDWKNVLEEHNAAYEKLVSRREAYCKTLESKKAAFLQKNGASDTTQYDRLKAEAEAEYDAFKKKLDKSYSEKLEQRIRKLNEKLAQSRAVSEQAAGQTDRMMPDDVLLRVKGLKMYFGGLKAVDDLTFDVKKGEIFGLIGPNGAGKTTVFNCITRFNNATGGDMYFENKHGEEVDLRSFQVHDVIVQGITRTFQNVELVREISVLENLLVACTQDYRSNLLVQILGLPSLHREERILKEKAMRILKFMGLESYAAWLAMGLPYGVLKKVEIARALMSDAKLIIMDEPAAGLNDTETAELTETIRRIRDEFGVTILLVEHDMGLVMNVCDTVCAISFGKMLAIGTCDEIKRNKAVQEAYLGVEEDA